MQIQHHFFLLRSVTQFFHRITEFYRISMLEETARSLSPTSNVLRKLLAENHFLVSLFRLQSLGKQPYVVRADPKCGFTGWWHWESELKKQRPNTLMLTVWGAGGMGFKTTQYLGRGSSDPSSFDLKLAPQWAFPWCFVQFPILEVAIFS